MTWFALYLVGFIATFAWLVRSTDPISDNEFDDVMDVMLLMFLALIWPVMALAVATSRLLKKRRNV